MAHRAPRPSAPSLCLTAFRIVMPPCLKADVVARRVPSEADIAGVYLVVADDRGAYQLAKPADAAAVVLIGLIAPVEVPSPDYLRRNATVHGLKTRAPFRPFVPRILCIRQIGDPAFAGFAAKRGDNGAKLGELRCTDGIAILSAQVHDWPDLQGAELVAAEHVE